MAAIATTNPLVAALHVVRWGAPPPLAATAATTTSTTATAIAAHRRRVTMTDLHYLTAADALAKFRSRELSPVELMEATIARAEAIEPDVNAFCFTYYDRALEQAKAAEAVYARNPDDARPLEGLPVGLKDEVEIEGEPATMASMAFKDELATETTPVAERILDAGGIIHARTTTPEFSCAGYTHSTIYGVTRNPWNLHYAVGGSSGG
ncbi:MAG: amidase, partial [Actinomycetes bacterium]